MWSGGLPGGGLRGGRGSRAGWASLTHVEVMVLKRSCPAVSQICSFTFSLLISTVLILKIHLIVVMCPGLPHTGMLARPRATCQDCDSWVILPGDPGLHPAQLTPSARRLQPGQNSLSPKV